MALTDQIIHGFKRGVLLFEEHTAVTRQADITVNHHQRHFHAVDQLHDRLLTHITRVQYDGVALPVSQHLHRLLFALGRVVPIGHNQLFAVRFGLARGLL
ncbi:hypothetical protein D3C85_1476770 [compost metagenome]